MKQSRFIALLIVAALISAAAWWLGTREQERFQAQSAAPLYPGVEAQLAGIDTVRIAPAGNEAFSLSLIDGRWTMDERDGYPVNTTVLRRELRNLATAKLLEPKTSNPAYYERLGVQPVADAEGITVAVSAAAAGTGVIDVLIGKPGKGGHYLRKREDERAWLTDTRMNLPRNISDWLDRQITEISRDRLRSIEVTPIEGKTYVLSRDTELQKDFVLSPALPEGRELNFGNVNRLGAALSNLRLNDVAKASDDGEAWNTTVFRTFDGLVVTARSRKIEGTDGRVQISAAYQAPAISLEAPSSDESSLATDESRPAEEDPAAVQARVQAEVEAINARAAGWTYTVGSYNATALNFDYDVLLKPPPEDL